MKKAPSKTKSDTIDSWVLIQKVQLAPLTLSIQDINNSLLLSCYIKNQLSNKSLSSNQVITINVFGQPHNFQIISIVPNAKQKELTKVGAKTVIDIIQIDAKERQQKQQQTENINLYGLDEELKQIQQIINNSIFNKGKLKKLGLNRIKGILILGINGMGKSSIVKYIENKMKKQISFKVFQSFNMLSKYVSGSQEYIKKIFNEAKKSQPSIIIFEDLHLLFSKKKTENETILSALLTEMENIKEQEQIVVIGTSNLERELDNNIKRAGRFQKQIILELPKHTTRQNIIKGFLNRIPNEMNETDVKQINMRLNGFSTGEIKQIIRESYLMDNSQLKKKNVLFVLKNFRPVGIKEILSEVPQTKWSDIGGYQQVKLEIRKVVEWPLQHPQAYKRLGIQPLKGILLYGPPGCSKTMMAKAIATESKLNFLSVKGSELFSKYVGESQKAVRNLFKRARSCSPCIIFFDEIDAIATQRSANTQVSERVLIQLLTQMDGIESLKQVTIVAATNRPQVLDEALMRPGRFDHLIYLPPPDREARKQIFKINLSRMAVDGDIEEISEKLAEITENYTGAEIGLICREGALRALSENINTDKISEQHFFDAKSKINNRLTPGSIQQYRGFKDRIKYGDEKKGLFG